MSRAPIKRLLIEEGAETNAARSGITGRLDSILPQMVKRESLRQESSSLDMDKETLRLISFPGRILKPCPGTKEYICCGYQILNVGTNCPFDCSYCILQAYFNQPSLRVFVNLEERLKDVSQIIDLQPEKTFRIGTGEFTDSLALDPVTGWSDLLLPFFAERKNAVLELKTKNDDIKRLLASKYRERIIVSWSLNSRRIAVREEKRAPGIEERIQAAKKCQEEGFALGFHFDPLIHHKNWKEEYRQTLDMLAKHIDPKGIIWMSMGCMRYVPPLKEIIRKRHPGTHILDGEFVAGLDGKMRYFKPIRINMYGFMAERLAQWYGDLGLYLCMESSEVWRKSLGWTPENTSGLTAYLDRRVDRFFGRA
ncbi:MAG: radical SAM protein [Pseudomonadota bacterium]